MKILSLLALGALGLAAPAAAQQSPISYGAPVSLEQAKKIVVAAERVAAERRFTMSFAVVDPTGELVLFHKMDGTQFGSTIVAQERRGPRRGSSGQPRLSRIRLRAEGRRC